MEPSEIILAIIASTALGSLVTGIITYAVSTREFKQARFTESTRLFVELAAIANSRRPDGGKYQLSEQIAAIHLVAGLGDEFSQLREPAKAFLKSHDDHFRTLGRPTATRIANEAKAARDRLS